MEAIPSCSGYQKRKQTWFNYNDSDIIPSVFDFSIDDGDMDISNKDEPYSAEKEKSAIVLRTQLPVRVHAIIEMLFISKGRELRKAVITLKQVLQSDTDLVHDFVANKGLDCLMQVGHTADHNNLDYILRALGQILLYVDGMHGVMEHKHCVRWLYSLISSKFRHVVKTALKLLLVFVEYTEKNCLLLIDAIVTVDVSNGRQPWYHIMMILQVVETSDTEQLIYATTLINRCLNNIPDRNTYYNLVNYFQDQGMYHILLLHMFNQGTDPDLIRQLQILEAVLLYENNNQSGTALNQLDESVITSVRRRSHNLITPEMIISKNQQQEDREIIKRFIQETSMKVQQIKISENELEWEAIKKNCVNRAFHLCYLDFTELRNDSDDDMPLPTINAADGPPPPPPVMFPPMSNPPPPPVHFLPKVLNNKTPLSPQVSNDSDSLTRKKKKTVQLFWQEIQDTQTPGIAKSGGLFWDSLPVVSLDTNVLEHLFEIKSNDLVIENLMEPTKALVIYEKKYNAINIAIKELPAPQIIKAAILKMDASVIGREGIEKLLTMLPSEEEKGLIQEAQLKNSNADLPLGSAEHLLLTLASINELPSRLKLWVFKLDFDNFEKEMAEPLMDLTQGIEQIKENVTFKIILSTLRSMGNFLNGTQVKGFRLEYLSKVMEVKDTVQKHPLLYHVCDIIMKQFPNSSDFFSEVGPVIRASKVNFDELNSKLEKLEVDCKASWDHMKRIAQHETSQIFKTKFTEFLIGAAERIILLTTIRNRVMNRFRKLLAHFGVPLADVVKTKPSEYLKVIAEFALEYRTTRERVLQQTQKNAEGKMIIDRESYALEGDNTADKGLKALPTMEPDSNSDTKKRKMSTTKNMFGGDTSANSETTENLMQSMILKRRVVISERRNRNSARRNLMSLLNGEPGPSSSHN